MGVLNDGDTETVKHEIKTREGGLLGALLASLAALLVQSLVSSAVKGIARGGISQSGRECTDGLKFYIQSSL